MWIMWITCWKVGIKEFLMCISVCETNQVIHKPLVKLKSLTYLFAYIY